MEALELRVADVTGYLQSERQRPVQVRPDILITTPETLQVNSPARTSGAPANVRYVCGRIHELANDERGAQLAVREKVVELAGDQRVGSRPPSARTRSGQLPGGVGRNAHRTANDTKE